jgi:hypothetical protein
MKPVRSVKNQYLGINAHLHSLWQAEGGWSDFHAAHITDLSKTLKAQLLPMGYTTEIEPSLQVRRADDLIGRPKSDVTIYDLLSVRSIQPAAAPSGVAELVLPLPLMLESNPISEKPYRAVAVFPARRGKRDRSKPVAGLNYYRHPIKVTRKMQKSII